MRDVCKQHRIATFTALNGNLGGINLYDEKKKVGQTDTLFVVFSTQQQTPTDDNDCTWISRNTLDIEIIQKSGSEVSKDVVDDLSNLILSILLPTPGVTNITSGNLQFGYARAESIISRNLSISDTESIIQKIIRFSVTIVQQS